MQNRKLKQTTTFNLLTKDAVSYNTPYYHGEFEKYYENARKFLPDRWYVPNILPIIRGEFGNKHISAVNVREAFNGRRIASRYYILLATLYYLLEKNVPIPDLDVFPDFFKKDYLTLNR